MSDALHIHCYFNAFLIQININNLLKYIAR